VSRRGNTHPPPWHLPGAAPLPAPCQSVPERTEGGRVATEGSCHADAGKEKQPRACPAGQEVLERPDPAHRKAKGGRGGFGRRREEGPKHSQRAGQTHSLAAESWADTCRQRLVLPGVGIWPHTTG